MKKYNYESLEIYNLSRKLVMKVYKLTEEFPKSEIFGLIPQVRRAAVSIILNIVEGSSRLSKKEFAIFIERSIGSLLEVRTAIQIAQDLGLIQSRNTEDMSNEIDELYFKMQSFKKYLRK